jgi:hypothetical protein
MLQKFFFFFLWPRYANKMEEPAQEHKNELRIQKIPSWKIMLTHRDRLASVEALTPT